MKKQHRYQLNKAQLIVFGIPITFIAFIGYLFYADSRYEVIQHGYACYNSSSNCREVTIIGYYAEEGTRSLKGVRLDDKRSIYFDGCEEDDDVETRFYCQPPNSADGIWTVDLTRQEKKPR